jgi:hypothetical protein
MVALGRLIEKHHGCIASLGYVARPCLKNKKKKSECLTLIKTLPLKASKDMRIFQILEEKVNV